MSLRRTSRICNGALLNRRRHMHSFRQSVLQPFCRWTRPHNWRRRLYLIRHLALCLRSRHVLRVQGTNGHMFI